MSLTEFEKQQIMKNEERLWDLAALTAAPTLFQVLFENDLQIVREDSGEWIAKQAYDLADAMILERRKRLKKETKK